MAKLYGKHTTEKRENRNKNLSELEHEKPLNINPVNVKRKLDNMEKVMDIEKIKFNLLKRTKSRNFSNKDKVLMD